MKIAVKLNPSWRRELAPGDRRLWFLGAVALRVEKAAHVTWVLEVLWKRVLAALSLTLLAGYLLSVTALYFWWDRLPGNQVGWADVALAPLRWQRLREKRGDSAVAVALQRLRERDFVEAYYGLRAGLARSPGNAAGRVALARLLAANDPVQALKVLEEGVVRTPNHLELLRALFVTYALQQSPTRALEWSARLLSPAQHPALDAAARRLVANTRAELLLGAKDAAAAEALLAELPEETDTVEGRRTLRLRAQALGLLGKLPEARQLLARQARAAQEDYRAEAELAIAADDAAGLESALRRMRATAPEQPMPYLYAVQAWHRMRRLTLRDTAESEFFQLFGRNDQALQLFAAMAVSLDLPDSVRRAEEVARASRFSTFAFRVHLSELALRRGDVDEAFRRWREWEPAIETLPPAQRQYPEFISRLIRASVAGGEQQGGGLVSHLSQLRGRATPAMYRLAADVLARAGHFMAARDVVGAGLRYYPYCESLRALEPGLVAASAKMAAPAPAGGAEPPVPAAVPVPPTAAQAVAQLDAALASDAYGTARDLLRAIRAGRAAWLEQSENALALRETELAVRTQDALTARAAVRRYLEKARPEADLMRLVRLAGQLARGDELALARMLHGELTVANPPASVSLALRQLNLPDDLVAFAASAATALAELDRALRQGRPADGLRLLEHVRRREPTWLGEARAELGVREVRLRWALDQRPLALAALKEIVIRPGASRAAAFRLVRDLIAEGDAATAQALAREIVRLLPEDKAALTLLREAEVPRPEGN